jgi:hypothetical protein
MLLFKAKSRLHQSQARSSRAPIENRMAYFFTILRNLVAEEVGGAEDPTA